MTSPRRAARAIVERDGIRVGFLAYASVFPLRLQGAGIGSGLAPMRSCTHYNPPTDNLWDPGAAHEHHHRGGPEDAEALIDDITATRERADVVVVSVHWGDSTSRSCSGAAAAYARLRR